DAAPVVLHFDDDVIALLEGVERDRTCDGLADAPAVGFDLDAVVDGIPHDVHEWVAQLLDDELVDLGLRTGDDQADVLPHLSPDLSNHSSQSVEHLTERHHAHLEDPVLHLPETPIEAALDAVKLGMELAAT